MVDTPPTATATATSSSAGTAAAGPPAVPAPKGPEVLKTQPTGSPAGGGWMPDKTTPMWAALLIGTAFACAPAILIAFPDRWGALASALLMGVAGSLSAYFGVRSAGPRQP